MTRHQGTLKLRRREALTGHALQRIEDERHEHLKVINALVEARLEERHGDQAGWGSLIL
jgi:hypothetical protein